MKKSDPYMYIYFKRRKKKKEEKLLKRVLDRTEQILKRNHMKDLCSPGRNGLQNGLLNTPLIRTVKSSMFGKFVKPQLLIEK